MPERTVADVVAEINVFIRVNLGMNARDADKNDFSFANDDGLRFKTGTSYGEVAIQVFHGNKPGVVLRILKDEQIPGTCASMKQMVEDYLVSQA